jgi:hypothetical protein
VSGQINSLAVEGKPAEKAAMKLIAKADVVLALGSRLGPFGTLPQHGLDYWPKNAKIIQIDADSRMLGLVKKTTVGICGDAKHAAVALLERIKAIAKMTPNKARLAEVQREKKAWAEELDKWPSPNTKTRIGPRQALAALARATSPAMFPRLPPADYDDFGEFGVNPSVPGQYSVVPRDLPAEERAHPGARCDNSTRPSEQAGTACAGCKISTRSASD